MDEKYLKAARILKNAKYAVAFTGAGISVESGIPPFRGENGLWSKYDPTFLDISYFRRNPKESWKLIKEIFYDFFGNAQPNAAHKVLADLEAKGIIKSVITQNIDHLHQLAGSKIVYEFHGTSKYLICEQCHYRVDASEVSLDELPPLCPKCNGILRPDFVFFGEPIPEPANSRSFQEAERADVFLVVGTTGEIMPAALVPHLAQQKGATIIEVNPAESEYTQSITHIHLKDKATVAMQKLAQAIDEITKNPDK
ncbi:RNA polymerase subunit sigma [candidate division KSB1 bacterium]|nr:MAG: RNA polymerase subunit sigma [candidate division KSB1 bacterium]